MDEVKNDRPPTWACVELMGHVKIAGRLTEEERFGAKMGRLDIPTSVPCPLLGSESHQIAASECPECKGNGVTSGFTTQLFGGASVYRITIVTEQVARQIARSSSAAPVSPWDFPKPAIGHRQEEASRVLPCGHTPENCDCDLDVDSDYDPDD